MKSVSGCAFIFVLGAASLFAQSAGSRPELSGAVTQTVTSLPGDPSGSTTPSQPPILNVLTVVGDNVLGVPCLDCLLGIVLPTLGLPSPVGKAYRQSNYQIDSFLVDNSYTGPCTFTFAVRDSDKNVIVSTTQTLMESANTEILLSAPVTIPVSAGIGLGSVSTTAVCGSNKTQSQSPVFIACVTNPPYCVD